MFHMNSKVSFLELPFSELHNLQTFAFQLCNKIDGSKRFWLQSHPQSTESKPRWLWWRLFLNNVHRIGIIVSFLRNRAAILTVKYMQQCSDKWKLSFRHLKYIICIYLPHALLPFSKYFIRNQFFILQSWNSVQFRNSPDFSFTCLILCTLTLDQNKVHEFIYKYLKETVQ